MSNVLAACESDVRLLQSPSWDACKSDVASTRPPSRPEVLALSSKERAAARAEEELLDVEHDAPFDETWPPDESHRPLDDDQVLEDASAPLSERYRTAWSALLRLHSAGILPKDALDRLVQMQDGARKLAGGQTTSEMLDQLERWLKPYEHEAASPVGREAEP